jgi:hypothetical protein
MPFMDGSNVVTGLPLHSWAKPKRAGLMVLDPPVT